MKRTTYRTCLPRPQLSGQNACLSVKKQLLQLCVLFSQAAADFCCCPIPGLKLFQIFRCRFPFADPFCQMKKLNFPIFQNLLFPLNLLQRKLRSLCLLKLLPVLPQPFSNLKGFLLKQRQLFLCQAQPFLGLLPQIPALPQLCLLLLQSRLFCQKALSPAVKSLKLFQCLFYRICFLLQLP